MPLGMVLLASEPLVVASALPNVPAVTWRLVFEDTFSGDVLNSSSWTVSNRSNVISRYDGHDALFIPERVSVHGGYLAISTVHETNSLDGQNYNFTSGWIDSQQKVNQSLTSPTRWEASMKMAEAEANGAWPAWWLLPEGACWPVSGEVDIVEIWLGQGHYQHSHPGQPVAMASTYHYGYSCSVDKNNYETDSRWYPSLNYSSKQPIIDFSADFHTFGVEINASALRFYVDGVTTFVRILEPLCVAAEGFKWGSTAYLPFEPMYGIINVAVQQNTVASSWWDTHNATTLVDWVRMYTLD
jgi:beta-glucanase (GH16 family)